MLVVLFGTGGLAGGVTLGGLLIGGGGGGTGGAEGAGSCDGLEVFIDVANLGEEFLDDC